MQRPPAPFSTFAAVGAAAVILAAYCASCCHGYVAVAPATMDGEHCVYERLKIKNNETLHSEHPCESFHCNAHHKLVYVEGCIAVGLPHAGCHVTHGSGPFPDCCERIVCQPDQPHGQVKSHL